MEGIRKRFVNVKALEASRAIWDIFWGCQAQARLGVAGLCGPSPVRIQKLTFLVVAEGIRKDYGRIAA